MAIGFNNVGLFGDLIVVFSIAEPGNTLRNKGNSDYVLSKCEKKKKLKFHMGYVERKEKENCGQD
jgi:hypothetical protein